MARAPIGQEPLHDDHETIASLWVRPVDALARQEAGELQMITPTISHLEYLAPFATTEEAMADAAAIRHPPTVEPELPTGAEGVAVVLPGDPGYGQAGSPTVG